MAQSTFWTVGLDEDLLFYYSINGSGEDTNAEELVSGVNNWTLDNANWTVGIIGNAYGAIGNETTDAGFNMSVFGNATINLWINRTAEMLDTGNIMRTGGTTDQFFIRSRNTAVDVWVHDTLTDPETLILDRWHMITLIIEDNQSRYYVDADHRATIPLTEFSQIMHPFRTKSRCLWRNPGD